MERITNVSALDYVLENCELPKDYAEKLTAMRATFARKNKGGSGTRALTATQKENIKIKDNILEAMELNQAYTAGEVGKLVGITSNQKVSALLKQLVDTGELVRFTEKRKSYFRLAKMGEF